MNNNRLLRLPEVRALVGLSTTTIYTRMNRGEFPKPISLGGRLVAWVEADIQNWVDDLINQAAKQSF